MMKERVGVCRKQTKRYSGNFSLMLFFGLSSLDEQQVLTP
jgi:hypothetical protein